MIQYDQYGQPYDDGMSGGPGDPGGQTAGVGSAPPPAPSGGSPSASGGPYWDSGGQPPGYQGIGYWEAQGQSPMGANGQLAPGFTRSANGYDYTAPTTKAPSYGGLGSLAYPTRPAYAPIPKWSFQAPTREDLYADPSYQARRDEGAQAIEQSAAGRGTLRTGGTLKDILGYGQNFASREYGNVYDRRFNEAKAAYEPQLQDWQAQNRVNELEFNRLFESAMSQLDDEYRYAQLGATV